MTRFDPAALPGEVAEFLADRHLATLSIVRADGRPHVTPVGFTWDGDAGLARVITWAGAVKVRLLEGLGPAPVALSQVDGGRWLTLEGTATVTADPERCADAVGRDAARYRPPGDRGPDRRVIEVDVQSILGGPFVDEMYGRLDPESEDLMHTVVDRATWLEARLEHLQAEKEFTRARDALSAARRELPWLEITEQYEFHTADGPQSLLDLFGDHDQLIVMHFMMEEGWIEGCPSCSFWADGYNGTTEHLAARDTSFVAISIAPLAEIDAYRERMGWTFPWVSSEGSRFNHDFGVSFTPEQIEAGELAYNYGTLPAWGEAPGMSAFRRDGDRVFLTYQTYSRGLDMLNATYHFLDTTSKGRDEGGNGMQGWLHRHDAYPEG